MLSLQVIIFFGLNKFHLGFLANVFAATSKTFVTSTLHVNCNKAIHFSFTTATKKLLINVE